MDEKFNRIPVSVIHLDKDGTVIDVEDYNLDKVKPDLWAIKGLAASLLPVIREFYTHEENVQAFVKRFPFSNPVTPVSKMGTFHLSSVAEKNSASY